jgi:hypothetical protein
MTLSEPALETLAEARVFAEHAGELAELEEHGWRFGLSDAGMFVAESGDGRIRRYDSDLGRLVQRCRSGRETRR